MTPRRRYSEIAIVSAIFFAGVLLRIIPLERQAVEHFDEGVYSSLLWYDAAYRAEYPGRHLYAPPLLSELIAAVSLVPGLRRSAPFLPSVVAGCATILMLWWLVRSWFGRSAGLFMVSIVALSDFHILYSRMALTDVLALLFICGSVNLGISGIHHRSWLRMLAAGAVCGLAWWTKYTGWLPLAIVGSGATVWWAWKGRREIGAIKLLASLLIMAAAAFLVWLPWLIRLQEYGGYATVAANHASYLQGFAAWNRHLSLHLTYQFMLDGITGVLSIGLGLFVAGSDRWMMARSSTWNWNDGSGDSAEHGTAAPFPGRDLLARFVLAAIALSAIAFTVWTPLLLTCIGLGGVAGIFLWPVLQRQFLRSLTQDLSPTAPGARALTDADLQCAPAVDPALAACTLVMWFLGMFAATPLYHPYPRLFLPLLASIWIASAAGVGWWIESSLGVARRSAADRRVTQLNSSMSMLMLALLAVAVAASLTRLTDPFSTAIFADRTSLSRAAAEVARLCVVNARGGGERPSADELRNQRLAVYAFGEPALLYHLSELGITAAPVSHLNLQPAPGRNRSVPEYLVIGPYAKRTSDFWEQWLERESGFRLLGEVEFRPSDLVLLNLFTPQWLRNHSESHTQMLEVYRILDQRATD